MKVVAAGNLDVYEEIIYPNFKFNNELIPSSYCLILNFDNWTYGFVKNYNDEEFKKLEVMGLTDLEIMVRKKKIEDLIK